MSQAAAALLMNPASVQQDSSASVSRTGSSSQPDKLRDLPAGRNNGANETFRTETISFKDVLEKRLPANSRQETNTSEFAGDEKPEKKKTKTSIRDLSNLALLAANPILSHPERVISTQLTPQSVQTRIPSSNKDPGKESGKSNLSSVQAKERFSGRFQISENGTRGESATQSTQVTQNSAEMKRSNVKDLTKDRKIIEEGRVSTKPDHVENRIQDGQRNPSSRNGEIASTNPTAGVGNPTLNAAVNRAENAKTDSQVVSRIKFTQGSRAHSDETPTQQVNQSTKKTNKTKTPNDVSVSQNENNGNQPAQSDGVLSFVQSQYDAKQGSVVSGRTESLTNPVFTTDNAQVPQSPGRQVVQAIRDQMSVPTPQSEIQMTLNPPELGKIRISFQQNNEEITGLLEVDKLRTRADIQKELPQVLASLQSAGVQIRRLDVVMNNSGNNSSPDQQAGHPASSDSFMKHADSFFSSDSRQEQGRTGSERSSRDFQLSQTPDNADQIKSFIRDDAINVYL